jgi:hypothetical protein
MHNNGIDADAGWQLGMYDACQLLGCCVLPTWPLLLLLLVLLLLPAGA